MEPGRNPAESPSDRPDISRSRAPAAGADARGRRSPARRDAVLHPRVHPHEVVLAAYLALTGLLLPFTEQSSTPGGLLAAGHLVAVLVLVLLGPRLARGRDPALRYVLALALAPVLYAEIGYLNRVLAVPFHDGAVQQWEARLVGANVGATMREAVPWRAVSEYLHFSYFSYYGLLPGLAGVLLRRGDRAGLRLALTAALATFATCFLCYLAFPVAGPWYAYPRPDPGTLGWVFPSLVRRVLAAGASRGTAFPSSHVAIAVVVWLLAARLGGRVLLAYTVLVPSLIVATVYGGFHYAVDAVAGIAVGVAGYLGGVRVHAWLGGAGDVRGRPASAGAPVTPCSVARPPRASGASSADGARRG